MLPCSQRGQAALNLGETLAAKGFVWLAGGGGTAAWAGFKRGEGETAMVATLATSTDWCFCPRTVGSRGLGLPGGPGRSGVASQLLLEEQLCTESFEDLCCLNIDPTTQ